jgi:diguanylate cyclase (GGDEF)-like protein
MEAGGTWLCPTAFDRDRLLEMEAKLKRPRAIMYGAIAITFVVAIPWLGWWILVPLAGSVLGYSLLRPRIAKSERPEYVIGATVVNAQLLIGVGIALTGGPVSPAIPLLLLPIVTLPVRFSERGVIAGVGITIAVLLASTVALDPRAFADDPTFTLIGLAAIGGLAAFADTLMRAEIEQRAHATLDPLTGLLNRKALAGRFAEIADQARLTGAWVSLIECDLDCFKEVNDAHGHDRGDAVLKEAAYVMRKNLRSFELVYRLGGEEFLVVLPGVAPEQGHALAEHLRTGIEEARPGGLSVTASFGIASARGAEVQFETLFREADAALYLAKRNGRNRVIGPDREPVPTPGAATAAAPVAGSVPG